MATEAMVLAALEQAVVAAVYPAGFPGTSVTGTPIPVYPGWPVEGALRQALAARETNVSIYTMPSMFRRTTRWQPLPAVVAAPDCTLLAANAPGTVTWSGTCAIGQVAGIQADATGYSFGVGAADTPATVAAALAALIPGATASGATVSVPGAYALFGNAVMGATTATITRQQERGFQVSIWAPNPADRDTVADAVDNALSLVDFLQFPDGSAGRLLKHGDSSSDSSENEELFRRDLVVTCDFPTVQTVNAPRVLFPTGLLHIGSPNTPAVPFGVREPPAVRALP